MKLSEAKRLLKENNYVVEDYANNQVYIVVMDGGEYDGDYAVFRTLLEAHKWGDSNCKHDYDVITSKLL